MSCVLSCSVLVVHAALAPHVPTCPGTQQSKVEAAAVFVFMSLCYWLQGVQ